jgi:hypothetical protein
MQLNTKEKPQDLKKDRIESFDTQTKKCGTTQRYYPSSKNESISDPPGFFIIWTDSKFVLPCNLKKEIKM